MPPRTGGADDFAEEEEDFAEGWKDGAGRRCGKTSFEEGRDEEVDDCEGDDEAEADNVGDAGTDEGREVGARDADARGRSGALGGRVQLSDEVDDATDEEVADVDGTEAEPAEESGELGKGGEERGRGEGVDVAVDELTL